MHDPHPFFRYTSEVLAWRLGDAPEGVSPSAPEAARIAGQVDRVVRHAAGRRDVVVLGLGAGAFAAALAAALPETVSLTVLCARPESARSLAAAGRLDWVRPDGSRQLVADTSSMAFFCLLAGVGLVPDATLVTVNPELTDPDERRELERWRRMFLGSRPAGEAVTGEDSPPPSVCLAVLARARTPDLAGFFAAAAGLADRAVVLWDAGGVPEASRAAEALDMPVVHLARRLENDFAAQRNALLAACQGDWVLSLDPDERPGPGFAAALRRITALPDAGGALFPRLTLYPDPQRAKVGYGLWPDVQLRLFRRTPPGAPRYVRPVHERLEGLAGRAVLALDAPLFHYNRLQADPEAVAAKLAGFDAAAGRPTHHLSADYPTLPLDFFAPPSGLPPGGRVLLLPPLW